MSYLNIPAELRGEKAWVNVWDGSKVPMQATVRKAASSSNPDTWSNYIDAEHNVQHGYYDGLGYVFHDTGVVGIDIDDGFTDGLLNPLAADIIGHCQSYTEKSRSGRGVHILVRGELPFKGKNNRAAVEIYKSNRYFIMTGEVLIFSEIVENQSAIDYVIEKYFPDTPKESSSGTVAPQRIYSPIYRRPENGKLHLKPEYPPITPGSRNLSLTSLAGQHIYTESNQTIIDRVFLVVPYKLFGCSYDRYNIAVAMIDTVERTPHTSGFLSVRADPSGFSP